jgi:hypothetical protein
MLNLNMVHPCSTNSLTQTFHHIQFRHGDEELSGDDLSGKFILVFYWPETISDFNNQPVNP